MAHPLNPDTRFAAIDFNYHNINEADCLVADPLTNVERIAPNIANDYVRLRAANAPTAGRFALTDSGNLSPRWRSSPDA